MKHPIKYLSLMCLCLMAPQVLASEAISLSYGDPSNSDSIAGRVGLQWHWDKHWPKEGNWGFTGFWELSYAYLYDSERDDGNFDPHVVAFTPVFRFERKSGYFRPFLEAGIGASVFTETRASYRKLSTAFQFEDHAGVGLRFGDKGQFDAKYSWWHYSNANIKKPNSGVNFHMFSFAYHFYGL